MKFKSYLDQLYENDKGFPSFALVFYTQLVPLVVLWALYYLGFESETLVMIIIVLKYLVYFTISLYLLFKTIKGKKAIVFLIYAITFWIFELMIGS